MANLRVLASSAPLSWPRRAGAAEPRARQRRSPPTVPAPALDSPANDAARHPAPDADRAQRHVGSDRGRGPTSSRSPTTPRFTAATTSNIAGFARHRRQDRRVRGSQRQDQRSRRRSICSRRPCSTGAHAPIQGTVTGAWSATGTFRSKLVGFNRAGELYDPLIHGETVGELVGSTTFIPGEGLRLNNGQSCVRYLLPQTITTGEFSMDVEGLRANAPGDKAKVFGMQEGQDDFITNRYRVDIQYRGTTGVPPNAIQWRVLYGSADDLDVRYEPDTAKRFSVGVPAQSRRRPITGRRPGAPSFRLVMREGGVNGTTLCTTSACRRRAARYAPSPHYAYLGAPVGRSGTESASIARHDLPQRLARQPPAAGVARQRAARRAEPHRILCARIAGPAGRRFSVRR